jgi:hypothetical protein
MSWGRSICKVDSNQPEIVATFRQLGWSVKTTHQLGEGFPDLVCGKSGFNALVEVKDGLLSPSKRKLTPDEAEFHASWNGPIYIIESVEDVIDLNNRLAHVVMGWP